GPRHVMWTGLVNDASPAVTTSDTSRADDRRNHAGTANGTGSGSAITAAVATAYGDGSTDWVVPKATALKQIVFLPCTCVCTSANAHARAGAGRCNRAGVARLTRARAWDRLTLFCGAV